MAQRISRKPEELTQQSGLAAAAFLTAIVKKAVVSYFALRSSYFRSMVGSATVTNSEMEIQGLERGKQYWFRVRAVRAGMVEPWSDQATRVANI